MGGRYFIRESCALLVAAVVLFGGQQTLADESGNANSGAGNTAEIAFWESVKDSKNPEELEVFLAAFPDGLFATLARIRLNGLRGPDTGGAGKQNNTPAADNIGKVVEKPVDLSENAPAPPVGLKQIGHVGLEFEDAPDIGIRIVDIYSYGTAGQSDLLTGDVIFAVNRKPVTSQKSFAETVRNTAPGDTVALQLRRGGVEKTIILPVGNGLERTWNAAHAGDVDAMRHLAWAFRQGEIVKKDFAENRQWLERAGEAGSGKAYYTLGKQYYDGKGVRKNKDKAFSYMMKSAELNYPMGQFWTAYLYGLGAGVTKNDERAVDWYRKAAAQGIAPAMSNLGIRYQVGRGVQKNLRQAADWYEKAADAGHLNALSGLGYMYKHGKGGRNKDLAKAVSLFRRANDKGNASGTYNLGLMYLKGIGVLEDRGEALRLFRLAAKSDKRAVKRLKKLGEPLYDLAEIQRLLADRGFEPGPADGKIGRKTRDAISRYQRQAGRDTSGEPSLDLVRSLRKSVNSNASASRPSASVSRNSGATASSGSDDLSDLATLD